MCICYKVFNINFKWQMILIKRFLRSSSIYHIIIFSPFLLYHQYITSITYFLFFSLSKCLYGVWLKYILHFFLMFISIFTSQPLTNDIFFFKFKYFAVFIFQWFKSFTLFPIFGSHGDLSHGCPKIILL